MTKRKDSRESREQRWTEEELEFARNFNFLYTVFEQSPFVPGHFYDNIHNYITSLMNQIKPREARVLRSYYGLDGKAKSLEEIGQEIEATRERVRQIRERGVENLRKLSSGKGLLDIFKDIIERDTQ